MHHNPRLTMGTQTFVLFCSHPLSNIGGITRPLKLHIASGTILVVSIFFALLVLYPSSALSSNFVSVGIISIETEYSQRPDSPLQAGFAIATDDLPSSGSCGKDIETHYFHLEFPHDAYAANVDIQEIYYELHSLNVDAVIAPSALKAVASFWHVAMDAPFPTLLIDSGVHKFGTVPSRAYMSQNILQFGLPFENVYHDGVSKWLDQVSPHSVAIVYDAGKRAELEKKLPEPKVFWQSGIHDFHEIPFFGNDLESQYDAMDKLHQYQPDAVVISSPESSPTNLVNIISTEMRTKSIYVASPVAEWRELAELSRRSAVPVVYGVQYWPDDTDPRVMSVLGRIYDELPWSSNTPFNSLEALLAFDSLNFVHTTICQHGQVDWTAWATGSVFSGLSASFHFERLASGARAMAPDIRLLTLY